MQDTMAFHRLMKEIRRFRHRVLSGWLLGSFIGGCFTPLLCPANVDSAENTADGNTSNACVLLKNDNVIFGTAYQVGEYVVIRKGNQSELRLPRTAVACWAGSPADLYRYRVDHREADGYQVYIQEAEWCLQNDLIELAKENLRQAKRMMPGSLTVARLEERILRATSPTNAAVPLAGNVIPVDHQEDSMAISGMNPAVSDLQVNNTRVLGEFARSTQVTLLNRCGNCHAPNTGRAWTIASPPGKTRASSKMTSENMLATLPFIDVAQPLNSPLLNKALTAHGGSAAPLGPRHAKAVDSLRRWLLMVGRSDSRQATIEPPSPSAFVSGSSQESFQPVMAAMPLDPDTSKAKASSHQNSVPRRMPEVEDPFDPDLFNRQFHR
jgi:hypothetical protein